MSRALTQRFGFAAAPTTKRTEMYELNLALTCFLYVLALIWFFTHPSASIFHPALYYLFFHGLVFVVRPLFAYYYDFTGIYLLYQFSPNEEVKNWALIVANLGLLSFLVPTAMIAARPLPFRDARLASRAGEQLVLTFLICLPLILLSLWYILSGKLGDLGGEALIKMTQDVTTRIAINENSNGYVNDANFMLGPFSVLIAWAFRFRPAALIPFAIFVFLRMYNGWARWTFVMASASFLLLYLYDHRSKWPGARSFLAGAALLVVFFLLGQNRAFLQQLFLGVSKAPVQTVERHFFDNMDFANLEYLEYVIRVVPDMSGTYDYFVNNLQIFTEPIPRVLWPGKPIGAPIQMFNYFDYGFPIGFTVSLPGQGWAQLGIFGVVIWCALGGIIWASFYRWFANSEQSRFQIALYCVTLPLSVQWFRDGVLLSLLKAPLFFVIPIFLWFCMCKVMPVASGQAAPPSSRSQGKQRLELLRRRAAWPKRRFSAPNRPRPG